MLSVYKLHFPNGRIYVGKTSKTLEERLDRHFRDRRKGLPIHHAIEEVGIEYVRGETVFQTDDAALAALLECELIAAHRPEALNVAPGGDGGDIFSSLPPDRQAALAGTFIERQARLVANPEYRAKLSLPGAKNGMFGKTHSEEVRAALSAKFRGKPMNLSEEARERRRQATSERRRAESPFTLDELRALKAEMNAGLIIRRAMMKFGLKQTTAEAISVGRHWSCRETPLLDLETAQPTRGQSQPALPKP